MGALLLALVIGLAVTILRFGATWSIARAPEPTHSYTLIGYWTALNAPSGPLEQPFGIAVAPTGDVYVTDARQRVVHLSAAGGVLGEWGGKGRGPGKFSDPVGIGVGPDRSVYVSDYDQDRIQKFAPDGRFRGAFGKSGDGPGQLDAPGGVAVDREGSLYVTDFYHHRVEEFRDGRFYRAIGHPGRVGDGALHYPTGVAITPLGEIVVADAYNDQLQWFDHAGNPIRRVGHHLFWLWPRRASGTQGFHVPTDAAVGVNRLIHLSDSGNHRIVMLTTDGRFISDWKLRDVKREIYSPEHIAVSPDGSTVYATDLASNRVIVLRVR